MHYRILPGHSFRDSDNSVKTGGDIIELSDDVAQANRDKVERLDPQPAIDAAPGAWPNTSHDHAE